ncbi:hypothetical protein Taro_022560 [Colocasia esculenta]|uniref:Uncharacterized protein n=1 Tax=Colocasia esculenta TaxID=4460 RepID=A0A843V8A3_COLES|nr:hypothetical protein [Colocasia esculenta]
MRFVQELLLLEIRRLIRGRLWLVAHLMVSFYSSPPFFCLGLSLTIHFFFSSDLSISDDEENEGNVDLIVPDKYTPLLRDSLPPHGMERGSTSRAGGDLISEVDFIEPSSHCPLPEAAVTGCVDSASAYAEYKAFAEQYPFTPIDAYIPGPAEEYPAAEAASSGNPPPSDFDDGGSPSLGLEALPEHGVDWPTRARPSPSPEDEDLWNFLVDRVRAVVDSEDPPPIDVVKRVLKEKTTLAFNSGISQNRWVAFVGDIWGEVCCRHGDLCSSANDADRRGSRITEVRKGQKARKLKITAEMENVVRLQRELEEARSSLEQEVKGDAKDSEEEAALIKDDEEHRRSTSFKTKEVERLKRKKPSWLRFGSKVTPTSSATKSTPACVSIGSERKYKQ